MLTLSRHNSQVCLVFGAAASPDCLVLVGRQHVLLVRNLVPGRKDGSCLRISVTCLEVQTKKIGKRVPGEGFCKAMLLIIGYRADPNCDCFKRHSNEFAYDFAFV